MGSQEFTELENIPNSLIGVHEAALAQSASTIAGIHCNCHTKFDQNQYRCKKAGIVCGSNCHPSSNCCVNRDEYEKRKDVRCKCWKGEEREEPDEIDKRDWRNGRFVDLEGNDINIESQEADSKIRDELANHLQGKERIESVLVDVFLSVLGSIEKKMNRNFVALYKEIQEEELLDKSWPKVRLSKPHDQHEYDFLSKNGRIWTRSLKCCQYLLRGKFQVLEMRLRLEQLT
ncbi:10233_t:CDS:2 [Dentiscutata heterogama]|uniref:10233_t:CDS:1 n=1 Tax=Dentiscutata heterogama TaxID=1316150 RepID=A0ACA9L3G5_9GLOM|nr:10233_t:CDS:2 [Dentiscutata heterogama]